MSKMLIEVEPCGTVKAFTEALAAVADLQRRIEPVAGLDGLLERTRSLAETVDAIERAADERGDAPRRNDAAWRASALLRDWRALREAGAQPALDRVLATLERLVAWGALRPPPDVETQAEAGVLRPPGEVARLELVAPCWSLLAADQFRLGGRDGAVRVPRHTRIALSEGQRVVVEHELEVAPGVTARDVVWLAPPEASGWRVDSEAWRELEGSRLCLRAELLGGLPLLPLAAGRLHERARASEVAHVAPRFGTDGDGWTVEVTFREQDGFDSWLTRVEAGPVPVTVTSDGVRGICVAVGEAGEACAHDLVVLARGASIFALQRRYRRALHELVRELKWRLAQLRAALRVERRMPDEAFAVRCEVLGLVEPFCARWEGFAGHAGRVLTPVTQERIVREASHLLADARLTRARGVVPAARGEVRWLRGVERSEKAVPWRRVEHEDVLCALDGIASRHFEALEVEEVRVPPQALSGASRWEREDF